MSEHHTEETVHGTALHNTTTNLHFQTDSIPLPSPSPVSSKPPLFSTSSSPVMDEENVNPSAMLWLSFFFILMCVGVVSRCTTERRARYEMALRRARRRQEAVEAEKVVLADSREHVLQLLREYTTEVKSSTFRRVSQRSACSVSDIFVNGGFALRRQKCSNVGVVSGSDDCCLGHRVESCGDLEALEQDVSDGECPTKRVRQPSMMTIPIPGVSLAAAERSQKPVKQSALVRSTSSGALCSLVRSASSGALAALAGGLGVDSTLNNLSHEGERLNKLAEEEHQQQDTKPSFGSSLSFGFGASSNYNSAISGQQHGTNSLLRCVPNECSVCIEPYTEGDRVTWSPNRRCQHAFHESCIVEWLATREAKSKGTNSDNETGTSFLTCPCCRQPFVEEISEEDESHGLEMSPGINGRRVGVDVVQEEERNVTTTLQLPERVAGDFQVGSASASASIDQVGEAVSSPSSGGSPTLTQQSRPSLQDSVAESSERGNALGMPSRTQ